MPSFASLVPSVMVTLSALLASVVVVTSLPMWKNQLYHFRRWQGHYMYEGQRHGCSVIVQSVQEDDNGGAMVMFSAEGTDLDMDAYSSDNIRIVFSQVAVYNASDHFFDEFQFVVEFLPQGKVQVMVGNITKPASKFSTIKLQSEKSLGYENHHGSSDLSIGLSVGISVFLFIVCVIISIFILRWAIRKGYLRHVARSYKNFRNPEGPVTFDNTQTDGGQESNVNVHI